MAKEKSKNNVVPDNKNKLSRGSYVSSAKWVNSYRLTDDVYSELDARNGLTKKVLNKLSNDRVDNWFEIKSDSEKVKAQIETINEKPLKRGGFQFKKLYKKAIRSAKKYGYSVLFFHYIDSGETISEPVQNPRDIVDIKLIEKTEVNEIILDSNGDIEYYVLNIVDGSNSITRIKIHSSRCIQVRNGDTKDVNGISDLKAAYNWLNIFDNIAWSVGQSFYRYAGGFPVVKLDFEETEESEIEEVKQQWSHVDTLNGFVLDKNDSVEFVGASGRGLNPKEYFDAGLQLIAIAFELPYALIAGVNAGAVTGSETNLKDYYSDVSSYQTLDDQPIIEEVYDKLIEVGRISGDNYKIEWNPLFEQNQEEIAAVEKINAETLKIYLEAGIVPKEIQDQIDNGDLILLDKPETSEPNTQVEQTEQTGTDSKKKTEPVFINGLNDARILKIVPEEKSLFDKPKYRKLEKKYSTELKRVFNMLKRKSTDIIMPFYYDSTNYLLDAEFKKNYNTIIKDIDKLFNATLKDFDPITGEFIGTAFDEGYMAGEKELGRVVNGAKGVATKNLITSNSLRVIKTLALDINKEIAVHIGSWGLNPPSNAASVRSTISKAFTSKEGRLDMGVTREVNSALNEGMLQVGNNDSMVIAKLWISVLDNDTTEDCTILNGQVVAIGEPFSTGDYAPPSSGVPHPCRSSIKLLTRAEAENYGFFLPK